MTQTLGILWTPQAGYVFLLFIGALAGWLASLATNSNHGLFTDILVGIAGSFMGSEIAELEGVNIVVSVIRLAMAVAGAVIIIYIWRIVHPARGPMQG